MYEPAEDTFMLLECCKSLKNKTILEIGCGTGIISKYLLKSNKVMSTDINPLVVKYCKSHKLNVIQSDLFENIKDKFDYIIFNPPYLPKDKEDNDITLYDKNIIPRFLKQAKSHLNKNGKILIIWSSLNNYKPLLKKLKYKFKTIKTEKFFFETLEVLECKN